MKVNKDSFSKLNGTEKAAVFMLSLGEELAGKVFAMMDEHEIREISQCMATLGNINSQIVEDLCQNFTEQVTSSGSIIGSFESTERLLTKVLPADKVGGIMEEIRGPAGRTMWDKLSNVNEEVLANFLKNEYPQTVAVVLSKIKPESASKVLSLLPESNALEVIMRIIRMESIQKEVIDEIEKNLRVEFMNNLVRSSRRDSYEIVAEMFNYLDRANEAKFISGLEDRNQEAAERVKALMFTFDDLLKVDNAGIQTILRIADKSKLALALKGSNEEIKELFFRNMSERAAKLLKEDMAALGMVRVKDVDEAQASIVMVAKDLSSRNEIVIKRGNDEGDQLIG